MRRPLISSLMFLAMVVAYHYSSAQTINGLIIDTETNKPLAYAHVGISGKGIGTISDENGQFHLQVDEDYQTDTLFFSIIGYRQVQIAIADLLGKDTKIEMEPSTIRLKEVIIHSKRTREQLKFGRTKPTKTTTGASGIDGYGIGQEIGTTIRNDGGNYRLNAISFHHRWNTADSLLYRINIYTIKNDLPDSSILQKDLFVVAYKGDKWVTLTIKNQSILFNQDLFVSIELVRRWNNNKKDQLFYSHGKGHADWKSYIRPISQAEWTKAFAFPLTLYLTVEKLD